MEQRGEWILIGTFEDGKVLGWILKSYSHELPQEVMITDAKNTTTNQVNMKSQVSPIPPVNVESQTPIAQPQTNEINALTQNAQDSLIYTSRVPSLNIRELPSTDTPIVGKLTPNDSVIIVETRDIWVRILDANTPSIKNGWVVRRSLTTRQ